MSPVFLRRFRAEKLLRSEFESLRARVLSAVRARLSSAGIRLDRGELEAAYALAWQGLYTVVLEGREIESPSAWLVLVTYRRAVDEHRAQRRARHQPGSRVDGAALEAADLAEDLDARIRIGQLLEGIAGRLSERERQAATLCYLQGLTRAEAASHMGISEGRMRKLMEGQGSGREGVSAKLGELTRTIEQGEWCESQGSLMRALAYGILARDGERYRQALRHHRHCPSCRAYVLNLRGLASVLPPTILPGARLALAGLAGVGRLRPAAGRLARHVHGGPPGSRAVGAAGASGGGGTLALTGPLGAKLAVSCLVALGVGASCIGIEAAHDPAPSPRRAPTVIRAQTRAAARVAKRAPESPANGSPRPGSEAATASLAPATVSREFGPEQALAASRTPPARVTNEPAVKHSPLKTTSPPIASAAVADVTPATRAAVREFGP